MNVFSGKKKGACNLPKDFRVFKIKNKKIKKIKMARLIKMTTICDAYLITTIIQFHN
jgi:hypothetical protein